MDRYKVLVIFICVVILPNIAGDSPCQLSKSNSQDVAVHHQNSTYSPSTTTLKTKSTKSNNSRKDSRKTRMYERDGRRGGTPDPPGSREKGGKRVPTQATTSDLKVPGQKTIDPRYTTKLTTKRRRIRTTPERISLEENCDYLAYYCLKAYNTGRLCARTLYYTYYTFKNYCMMDYVNCMERFETWQMVHMGPCFNIKELEEYNLYPYQDDYFLDQAYVIEEM